MKENSYIDKYSWKCLLGKMSKEIKEEERYATWMVNKVRHIVLFCRFEENDFEWLSKYVPFNFHYFSPKDLEVIGKKFKVEKSKCSSVGLELDKTLNPVGKKNRGLRNKINRMEKLDIEVLNNFKSISDVEQFVKHWSDFYSLKYFRDYSGKNLHFYSNNFHKDCINSFCYLDNKLVAYGTLSPPVNGHSIYIIGKAFYKINPILSEFLDFSLYKKGYELGTRFVQTGRSSNKEILKYKQKFPGAVDCIEYEGRVKENV